MYTKKVSLNPSERIHKMLLKMFKKGVEVDKLKKEYLKRYKLPDECFQGHFDFLERTGKITIKDGFIFPVDLTGSLSFMNPKHYTRKE